MVLIEWKSKCVTIFEIRQPSILQSLESAWVDLCGEILYNVTREIIITPVHVTGGDQAKVMAWKTF